jgi:hypothetical protein
VVLIWLSGSTLFAEPVLSIGSGAFLYDVGPNGTFDVKDSVSNSGPTLSRNFSTAFSYTDPSVSGSLITGTYSATASAQFGVLKGSISSTQSGTENPGRSVPLIAVYTSAYFQDTLTILQNPYLLTPGFFFMSFAISGSGQGDNSLGYEGVHSTTWGGFSAGMAGVVQTTHYLDTTNKAIAINPVYSDAVFFTPGVPVSISASLGPALSISCNTGLVGHPCDGWIGTAISNFGTTAVMVGLEVYDAQGNLVPTFEVSSASGTVYTADGVVPPLPEPYALTLLATGCAASFARRLRASNIRREHPF